MMKLMINKRNLDDIVEYLDNVHPYSGYISALCPFHSDENPSLLVNDDGFSCRACGAHGSLDYLYHKLTGFDTVSHIKIPTKPNRTTGLWKRWLTRFGDVQTVCRVAHNYVLKNPSAYFKKRKIDSMIQSCLLGYLEGFYLFPVLDKEHKIIGCTARASPTIQTKEVRYSVSPDCTALYVPDWKQVLTSDYLIVVFGIFDALGLSICGFSVVTGITGASFNSELLDEFRKTIYVLPDLKEERQALELVSQLDWRGTPLYLDWPDNTKDCADIREQYNDKVLMEFIRKSINASKVA